MPRSISELIPQLLPIAALTLRWPPDVFWRATPAEFAAALQPLTADAAADQPLSRRQFDRLLVELQ